MSPIRHPCRVYGPPVVIGQRATLTNRLQIAVKRLQPKLGSTVSGQSGERNRPPVRRKCRHVIAMGPSWRARKRPFSAAKREQVNALTWIGRLAVRCNE